MTNDPRLNWSIGTMAAFAIINILGLVFLGDDIRSTIGEMSGLTFLILALGVYRLTDIVTHEKVSEPIRGAFAGQTEGWRGICADILACNSCLGVWVSMIVAYAYIILPEPTFVIMVIMALTGLEGFFSKIYNFFDRREAHNIGNR